MASPGQKRGGCGHLMAGFDSHNYCAKSHNRGKGSDPCVEKPEKIKEWRKRRLLHPSWTR